MPGQDPGPEERTCGDDVAAYALGALEAEEAQAFQRHLQTCVVCRDELAAFEQVVSVLPMSAPPHKAPAALRRKVLRAVEADARGEASSRPVRATRRRRSWTLLPRPVATAGAVLAFAAVAFVGVELASSPNSGTRVITAEVVGTGSAQLRVGSGHAELIVRHFPAPPAGHIYEVWLERAGRSPAPTSALFSVTAMGSGDVDVPGDLHGVAEVLVTPEPAGGSAVPTHAPVIRAVLT